MAAGRPDLLLFDIRPALKWPTVIISSHDVAEQLTRPSKMFPRSTPKSPTIDSLVHLVGPRSILKLQGDEWWQVRKKFNPGFAPSYLVTLLPRILEKTSTFMKHLDSHAAKNDVFSLMDLTTNLTFDIIGAVVMDADFQAQQSPQGRMIQLFTELLSCYTGDQGDLPWWTIPRTELRRRRLNRQIDHILSRMVRAKFIERQQQDSVQKARSVLDLSLQETRALTDDIISETCDQLKTFLFAGHDTTSIMLSWAAYELSRKPQSLDAARKELDELFGTEADYEGVRAKLLSSEGPEYLRKMPYVAAVVKEVLRLHPPAGAARMTPTGSGCTVRTGPDGADEVCLDGLVLYVCHSLIQRDPSVYGPTANDFMPERWLEENGARKIPAGAWRPVSWLISQDYIAK